MGFKFDTRIKGIQELDSKLSKLKIAMRNKVLRGAVRAGAAVIRKEMMKRVPIRHKELKKAIAIVIKIFRTTNNLEARIAIKRPKAKVDESGGSTRIDPVRYHHLVELGTRHSAATPFMRESYHAKVGEATRTIERKAKELLHKEINKF